MRHVTRPKTTQRGGWRDSAYAACDPAKDQEGGRGGGFRDSAYAACDQAKGFIDSLFRPEPIKSVRK